MVDEVAMQPLSCTATSPCVLSQPIGELSLNAPCTVALCLKRCDFQKKLVHCHASNP
jgi:hypothetical protein